MSLQLETQLWVQALTRRANIEGSYSTIERVGDKERGDVLVKIIDGKGGGSVYGKAFNPDGPTVFRRLPQGSPAETESDANAYIEGRITSDPDLWIVEIQDHAGRHFLTERILDDKDPFS